MSPYNILSDIKSGRIQVKSMDSATILFFKCQRWDCITNVNELIVYFFLFLNKLTDITATSL